MEDRSKKRIARFVSATIVALCALSSCAWADVVYATATGELGIVERLSSGDFEVKRALASGLGQDASLLAFRRDDRPYVLAVTHAPGGDSVTAWDASHGWGEPVARRTFAGITDVHGLDASRNGRAVFAAARSASGDAQIIEIRADAGYVVSADPFVFPKEQGDAQAVRALVRGNEIYGLFAVSSGGAWRPSKLVRMDGRLVMFSDASSCDVGANATDMLVADGRVAVSHWGGPEGPGASGGVDLFFPNRGRDQVEQIVSGDAYGGVVTLCEDGDEGMWFVRQRHAGDGRGDTLWRRTRRGELTQAADLGSSAGAVQLAWDDEDDELAVMTEDGIRIYDADGALRHHLPASALGGTPVSIATVRPHADESKNGDCGTSGMGALALLSLAALRRRRIDQPKK